MVPLQNISLYLQSEDFADQYISDIIRNVYRIGQGYTTIENNGFYDKIDEHIYYDRSSDFEFIDNWK